ncbi:uncharacterized protein ASCRUDRAFT_82393 [Ascoidea rubescens DSM 1968]|uniref:Uncharacterized protein n=1 Tax=Ascoidea rubescens DSM 1968 TaxID=1344418 RepID=A0A1D2VBR6_9ASCO|nr:hypothetical protein ASCRUDRAFT_82393 [Ascoidea rubescens DSM 1968]ODV59069.1 hypothetical protein ASCRUDRAFT_82393 [Ascoidea rubescens DSM 1968]
MTVELKTDTPTFLNIEDHSFCLLLRCNILNSSMVKNFMNTSKTYDNIKLYELESAKQKIRLYSKSPYSFASDIEKSFTFIFNYSQMSLFLDLDKNLPFVFSIKGRELFKDNYKTMTILSMEIFSQTNNIKNLLKNIENLVKLENNVISAIIFKKKNRRRLNDDYPDFKFANFKKKNTE